MMSMEILAAHPTLPKSLEVFELRSPERLILHPPLPTRK
jgi:hypothetical protein